MQGSGATSVWEVMQSECPCKINKMWAVTSRLCNQRLGNTTQMKP